MGRKTNQTVLMFYIKKFIMEKGNMASARSVFAGCRYYPLEMICTHFFRQKIS
jgi:hypothetical protein